MGASKLGVTVVFVAACLAMVDSFSLTSIPQLRRSTGSEVTSRRPMRPVARRLRRRCKKLESATGRRGSASIYADVSTMHCGVTDMCNGRKRYWEGMNNRDIEFALEQFSDEIFFQDMMFPEPLKSKEELRAHFQTCLDGFPEGLVFVIDEISKDAGDGRCGAYWHCETPEETVCVADKQHPGKAFPFSRGLSFYKCDAEGKLVFAREIPEPSTKTGGAGLAFAKFGSFMMQFVPDSVVFPKI